MPEPETKEAKSEELPTNQTENTDVMPVRDVSQTDHLNKKLLTSLFNRMDEGGDSTLSKMMEPDENNTNDDEWDD